MVLTESLRQPTKSAATSRPCPVCWCGDSFFQYSDAYKCNCNPNMYSADIFSAPRLGFLRAGSSVLKLSAHANDAFTGSQESILQLDMDMEEGDLIDDHSSTDGGGYQRRHSVSPLPQIRASNEHQLSRSSSESDLDREHRRARGSTSLQHSNRQSLRQDSVEEVIVDGASGCATVTDKPDKNDICVGCLAAALNKKQRNIDGTFSQDDADSDSYPSEQHGSSSLPATLKKYKGNHSTGSCRGMNPPDHYHQYPPQQQQSQQSKLPFKFYKTEGGQVRKSRTPLKNLMSQSKSAPCDDGSLTDINLGCGEQTDPSEVAPSVPGINREPKSARRCSLSRTSSSGSESRNNFAHYQHQLQPPPHQQQSSASDPDPDDDGSDETEPNSDNDLIAKSRDGNDAADGKKK